MSKKSKSKVVPEVINITSVVEAAAINAVFETKDKKDLAESAYNTAKSAAQEVMFNKLTENWVLSKRPKVGAYEFHLPNDGGVRTVNVQNRSSTKSFTPAEAKKAIDELKPDFKPTDTFDVSTSHTINSAVLKIPIIRNKVMSVLTELEAQLKKDGMLPADANIVSIQKKCVLNQTALDRVVVLSQNSEHLRSTLEVLKNPVTLNMIG